MMFHENQPVQVSYDRIQILPCYVVLTFHMFVHILNINHNKDLVILVVA